MFRKVTV